VVAVIVAKPDNATPSPRVLREYMEFRLPLTEVVL
jgi:hypothetical protein